MSNLLASLNDLSLLEALSIISSDSDLTESLNC